MSCKRDEYLCEIYSKCLWDYGNRFSLTRKDEKVLTPSHKHKKQQQQQLTMRKHLSKTFLVSSLEWGLRQVQKLYWILVWNFHNLESRLVKSSSLQAAKQVHSHNVGREKVSNVYERNVFEHLNSAEWKVHEKSFKHVFEWTSVLMDVATYSQHHNIHCALENYENEMKIKFIIISPLSFS